MKMLTTKKRTINRIKIFPVHSTKAMGSGGLSACIALSLGKSTISTLNRSLSGLHSQSARLGKQKISYHCLDLIQNSSSGHPVAQNKLPRLSDRTHISPPHIVRFESLMFLRQNRMHMLKYRQNFRDIIKEKTKPSFLNHSFLYTRIPLTHPENLQPVTLKRVIKQSNQPLPFPHLKSILRFAFLYSEHQFQKLSRKLIPFTVLISHF